jgi:fluoride exporter
MIKQLLIISFGGGLGSIARYLTALFINKLYTNSFPFSTMVANLLGCLIIGIVYGLSERYAWLTPTWRLLLATGFCGGYTTFSTFAFENLNLLQTNQFITFAAYSLISFVGGLLAVWIGLSLVK